LRNRDPRGTPSIRTIAAAMSETKRRAQSPRRDCPSPEYRPAKAARRNQHGASLAETTMHSKQTDAAQRARGTASAAPAAASGVSYGSRVLTQQLRRRVADHRCRESKHPTLRPAGTSDSQPNGDSTTCSRSQTQSRPSGASCRWMLHRPRDTKGQQPQPAAAAAAAQPRNQLQGCQGRR
jgi:hypothetical protein